MGWFEEYFLQASWSSCFCLYELWSVLYTGTPRIMGRFGKYVSSLSAGGDGKSGILAGMERVQDHTAG